ncbi:MAG: hypothetical protein AB1515_01120, partial [Nitrospirota bacterium]
MLNSPYNRPWRRVFLALAAAAALSYGWYAYRMAPSGGTTMGLIYGVIGLVLILFLLFYAVRKRWHRCVYGKTEIWLNGHLYLGLLALLLVYFHAGFRFHELSGALAALLLTVVTISGVAGAVLYALLPRRLTEVESNAAPEDVAKEMNQLAERIYAMGRTKSQAFREVCQGLLEENAPAGWLGWRILFSQQGGSGASAGFRRLVEKVRTVPVSEQQEMQRVM